MKFHWVPCNRPGNKDSDCCSSSSVRAPRSKAWLLLLLLERRFENHRSVSQRGTAAPAGVPSGQHGCHRHDLTPGWAHSGSSYPLVDTLSFDVPEGSTKPWGLVKSLLPYGYGPSFPGGSCMLAASWFQPASHLPCCGQRACACLGGEGG